MSPPPHSFLDQRYGLFQPPGEESTELLVEPMSTLATHFFLGIRVPSACWMAKIQPSGVAQSHPLPALAVDKVWAAALGKTVTESLGVGWPFLFQGGHGEGEFWEDRWAGRGSS